MSAFTVCYVVRFKDESINVNDYEELKKDVRWARFGKTNYHAYCELTKEKLTELICKEIGIESDDVTVINTVGIAGMGF